MTQKNAAAVTLGRLGGLAGKGVTTPKKARAARKNGKRGGRPRVSPALAHACAVCGALARQRCRTGTGKVLNGYHRARQVPA